MDYCPQWYAYSQQYHLTLVPPPAPVSSTTYWPTVTLRWNLWCFGKAYISLPGNLSLNPVCFLHSSWVTLYIYISTWIWPSLLLWHKTTNNQSGYLYGYCATGLPAAYWPLNRATWQYPPKGTLNSHSWQLWFKVAYSDGIFKFLR